MRHINHLLQLAPTGFGLMWTVSLVTVGRRLRRVGQVLAPRPTAAERFRVAGSNLGRTLLNDG
jgi:hypothetical protein